MTVYILPPSDSIGPARSHNMSKPGVLTTLVLWEMVKGYGMATELPGQLEGLDWGEPVKNSESKQRRSSCTRNTKEGAAAQGLPCAPSMFMLF
jgi:hypothetical protein